MSLLSAHAMRYKARAAYVGLAIGDALGATVEFMTPNEIATQYKIHKNIIGGGWLKLKPGRVTDDTEMSLALGIALLACKEVKAKAIAEAFSAWMRGKPVDIGDTVRRGIMYYRTHGETTVPKSEFSAGNGACMRSLPIALATLGSDRDTVNAASRIQSHVTHHADLSDAGTEHVIELIQLALSGHSKKALVACSQTFVQNHSSFRFDQKVIQNPGGFIVDTLQAVLHSFYASSDFESCLIHVVNKGGDADTTGAIAGMIAGACYGMDSIPERWLHQLDQKILKTCIAQADDLLALAPVSITSEVAWAE